MTQVRIQLQLLQQVRDPRASQTAAFQADRRMLFGRRLSHRRHGIPIDMFPNEPGFNHAELAFRYIFH